MKLSAFFCSSSRVGRSFNFSFSWLLTWTKCYWVFFTMLHTDIGMSKGLLQSIRAPQGPSQWRRWCCSWFEGQEEEAPGHCLAQPAQLYCIGRRSNQQEVSDIIVSLVRIGLSCHWQKSWLCFHLCVIATKALIEGPLLLDHLPMKNMIRRKWNLYCDLIILTSATASPALKATPASLEMMLIQELPWSTSAGDHNQWRSC